MVMGEGVDAELELQRLSVHFDTVQGIHWATCLFSSDSDAIANSGYCQAGKVLLAEMNTYGKGDPNA